MPALILIGAIVLCLGIRLSWKINGEWRRENARVRDWLYGDKGARR